MNKERGAFSTRRFLVGKAGPFPRLVFRENVMLRLDEFAHLHAYGEHGGFLIGRRRELKSEEQYEVLVERFVPIPQQKEASRLVINREHWETVMRALAEANEDEEIVGWAHTHPGFGIFLSNFDKEQHLRFFPNPWQIAYVMDTHAQKRAAYYVREDKWHKLDGYYVLRTMPEGEIGVTVHTSRKAAWPRLAFLVLLLALFIGVGVYGYGWVRDVVTKAFIEPAPIVLEEKPQSEQFQGSKEIPPAEKLALTPVESEPERTVSKSPPIPPSYEEYIVLEGDNLWQIAEKLWGDPRLFILLAEENDIKNPSVIRVGKVLKVPPRPN